MAEKERRRSSRASVSIPLRVTWTTPEGTVVEEETHTEAFSDTGARIRLKNPIAVGQEISILNQQNQESASARLVWASEHADDTGRRVAFAFLAPSPDFWGTLAYGS